MRQSSLGLANIRQSLGKYKTVKFWVGKYETVTWQIQDSQGHAQDALAPLPEPLVWGLAFSKGAERGGLRGLGNP